MVNAAGTVESNVWPKPFGEDGHWEFALMGTRILALHGALQEERRATDEVQGRGEEAKEW